ncbi:MAG: N-6 DNA methylase, partial [Candidatus Aminicenantes bacterium]|nr:N-6 DNA methylase [Candidatus Aminicenantes bacterium]
KPEVRKAGGVYYTPSYIVEYIVKNTVGKQIKGKSPAQLAGGKSDPPFRVLDMACGSGSFLLGAYQCLLDHSLSWYLDNKPEAHKKAVYKDSRHGQWRLTIEEKKRLLIAHIFGVDIDPQAVEVSKLSLLLKVLEGETDQTFGDQMKIFEERALPNLSDNIKCGNSLIGPDYFSGKLIPDPEELKRVNPFDWNQAFPEAMKAGGFDCVIGNPPYVFARGGSFNNLTKKYYYQKFPLACYQLNTYLLFIIRAFSNLRNNGYFGYIIPNTWLTIDSFSALRKWLLEETGNLQIINIFDKVFYGANVDTCLLLFQKNYPTYIEVGDFKNGKMSIFGKFPSDRFKKNNYIINIALVKDADKARILDKINNNSKALDSYSVVKAGLKAYETGKGKPIQTDEMKKARIYHNKKKINADYGKYLEGKDVKRYLISWSGWWIKYGECLAAPRKIELFTSMRILVRQIPSSPPYSINAVLTDEYMLNDINSMIVYNFHDINPLFILAVLACKITTFWFVNTFDKFQRKTFPQFKVKELAIFPIPTLKGIDQNSISQKAQILLNLHKTLALARTSQEKALLQRQIDATDREIDQLVYELYGLTKDEIKIVEGEAK